MTDHELRRLDGRLAEHVMGWNCQHCDCSLLNLGPEIDAVINSSGVRIRAGNGERYWRPTTDLADHMLLTRHARSPDAPDESLPILECCVELIAEDQRTKRGTSW